MKVHSLGHVGSGVRGHDGTRFKITNCKIQSVLGQKCICNVGREAAECGDWGVPAKGWRGESLGADPDSATYCPQ